MGRRDRALRKNQEELINAWEIRSQRGSLISGEVLTGTSIDSIEMPLRTNKGDVDPISGSELLRPAMASAQVSPDPRRELTTSVEPDRETSPLCLRFSVPTSPPDEELESADLLR
jgi:hypothetical protein